MNENSKIEKILAEGEKCRRKYGIVGPTGPAGPAGVAGMADTIVIRNTITTDPWYEARVDDFGTGSNHILDFIIPKGEKGDTGEIGPTGPAGVSVNILGSYDSYTDLKNEHPTGASGDGYLVDGNLYVWSANTNDWVDVGSIKGPKGDTGDIGPVGPTGPSIIKTAYLATFNNANIPDEGIIIVPGSRIPIEREELNVNDIISLNGNDSSIRFNLIGYYKITIIISAYPQFVDSDFDKEVFFEY